MQRSILNRYSVLSHEVLVVRVVPAVLEVQGGGADESFHVVILVKIVDAYFQPSLLRKRDVSLLDLEEQRITAAFEVASLVFDDLVTKSEVQERIALFVLVVLSADTQSSNYVRAQTDERRHLLSVLPT